MFFQTRQCRPDVIFLGEVKGVSGDVDVLIEVVDLVPVPVSAVADTSAEHRVLDVRPDPEYRGGKST